MTIHKILHFAFIFMFVITALLCVVFIFKKLKSKKIPKEFSKEKFDATMIGKMIEVTNQQKSMFNIWPFVSNLKLAKILSKKGKEQELVYKVYRNSDNQFEHVLLFTQKENNFVVIIVDLVKKKIKGYFLLDLQKEYDL
jgi:serine/threonine-protein kinase RIO1